MPHLLLNLSPTRLLSICPALSCFLLLVLLSASPGRSSNAHLLQPQIPLNPELLGGGHQGQAGASGSDEFQLEYIFHHGTYLYPNLHRRLDVHADDIRGVTADDGASLQRVPRRLRTRRRPMRIERLVDRNVSSVEGYLSAARRHGSRAPAPGQPAPATSWADWTVDQVDGPDVTDKETVLSLAKMAANAYIMLPGTEKWADVSGPFNHSQNFGWQDDGLRGHIYATADNATVVVSLKGTTTALFDGQGTTTNDKENDNLYFSCCCGQGGSFLWRQVCDCATDTYACNATCLAGHLRAENRYYRAALDLYANVTALYPASNVWVVGHSLGGAVSSMLGQTYGLPVVTFEALPERLPSTRLGLPRPPPPPPRSASSTSAQPARPSDTTADSDDGVEVYGGAYHFGHTADPIYMGTCNSMTSVCTLAGYALESSCHSGFRCVYDTVADLGWRQGLGTHRILTVISDVIERYDSVPRCERDEACVDCFNWNFYESNGTEPSPTTTTTTTTQTKTRTKTATQTATTTRTVTTTTASSPTASTTTSSCKTPGWWGCLDEDEPTSTATSTSSTTTCHTPGWFGCLDATTTTTTATTEPATTSSCKTPGWWGCRDPTPAATTSPPSSTVPSHPASRTLPVIATGDTSTVSSSTTACLTPGRFFGCWDEPTQPTPTSSVSTCLHRGFFRGCRD